jgi:hypothetical protein
MRGTYPPPAGIDDKKLTSLAIFTRIQTNAKTSVFNGSTRKKQHGDLPQNQNATIYFLYYDIKQNPSRAIE